ncbi:hypothetical protein HZA97_00195 [Candidatus Woesearchaeota archaeon]|nr:hypothetical protein [Candidatus Woesearchaeota archaeon]
MVWKSASYGPSEYTNYGSHPTSRVENNVVAYVGTSTRSDPKRNSGSVERIAQIDDDLLCFNAEAGSVLVRIKENDRKFDTFIKLPFTKGVTERETGRTLLILGDLAHHGEAMQGQFDVSQDPYQGKGKAFGNTIRWINVGGISDGFLGLDYRPNAPTNSGVARNEADVKFLANMLLNKEAEISTVYC